MFLDGFLDVNGCLNAVFDCGLGYGKSPCFLRSRFLSMFGVDYPVLNSFTVDGVDFLD